MSVARTLRPVRPLRLAAAGAATAAMLLTGCSSSTSGKPADPSTSVSSQPSAPAAGDAQGLLDTASAYLVDTSHPVRLSGQAQDGTDAVSFDLSYVGDDSSGTVGFSGATVQILYVGGKFFFKGDDALWQQFAGDQADTIEAVVGDKWIQAPVDDSRFASFAEFGTRSGVTEGLLKPDGSVTIGDTSTIDGVDVVALHSSEGGTLYLASDDSRPIQLSAGGQAQGQLDFDYDDQTAVQEPDPSDVVDVSALGN